MRQAAEEAELVEAGGAGVPSGTLIKITRQSMVIFLYPRWEIELFASNDKLCL